MAKASPPERLLLLGLIVDQLVDAVVTVTPDQQIVIANEATGRLFGYEHDELIGMSLCDLMPQRFRDAHRRGVEAYLATGGTERQTEGYIDVLGLTKCGDEIPMSLSMTCMLHDGLPYLTGVLRDMSALSDAHETIRRQLEDLKSANDLLQRLADQDHLTGVMNRRALQRLLPDLWRASDPNLHPMAVLLCDIDHFKQYNDTYGHLEGDKALIAVATAIRDVLGDSGIVARFGGEEFIMLLKPGVTSSAADAAEAVSEAVRSLGIPHTTSTASSIVTISVGGAIHEFEAPSHDVLLRRADDALYVAKRARNRCIMWTPMLMGE